MSWGPATVFVHCRLRLDGSSTRPLAPPRGLNKFPSDQDYNDPNLNDLPDDDVDDEGVTETDYVDGYANGAFGDGFNVAIDDDNDEQDIDEEEEDEIDDGKC